MTDDALAEESIEQENYFVSMTDMMVGLVFIFIILLMYFAVQFKQTTDQLTSADETRARILVQVQDYLKAKGVPVEIDRANGLLRLPDAILFDSAQAAPKPGGKIALRHLADALMQVLPCYADGVARPNKCPPSAHKVESIFIEGHTDSDTFAGAGGLHDNWDLSVMRATNTFRELIDPNSGRPELGKLCETLSTGKCTPVLSVSGYGDGRPADISATPEAKAHNRRIDVRILMVSPHVEYPTLGDVGAGGVRSGR